LHRDLKDVAEKKKWQGEKQEKANIEIMFSVEAFPTIPIGDAAPCWGGGNDKGEFAAGGARDHIITSRDGVTGRKDKGHHNHFGL